MVAAPIVYPLLPDIEALLASQPERTKLGKTLIRLRLSRELTRAALSQACGLSEGYLKRIENSGKWRVFTDHEVTPNALRKIAVALAAGDEVDAVGYYLELAEAAGVLPDRDTIVRSLKATPPANGEEAEWRLQEALAAMSPEAREAFIAFAEATTACMPKERVALDP